MSMANVGHFALLDLSALIHERLEAFLGALEPLVATAMT